MASSRHVRVSDLDVGPSVAGGQTVCRFPCLRDSTVFFRDDTAPLGAVSSPKLRKATATTITTATTTATKTTTVTTTTTTTTTATATTDVWTSVKARGGVAGGRVGRGTRRGGGFTDCPMPR